MNKKQILIVEDERIVATDIKMSLQKFEYAVCGIAHSGEEAVKKAEENHVDLVLMDIALEGEMDGIEAASIIRSRFNIPVVYLTAHSDEKTLERAKITEPFGYILKPFMDKDLHATIDMAFYKFRMERKLKESEEWFSTTLKSIGDAVIATDTKSRVTFINPVAQTLTGWNHEDAAGKSLKDVFIHMNDGTGKPGDDSASKVLKKGKSIGPVNNTTLVAKDGTKRPINYSCAPIKFEKGNIAGAVLAFQDISELKRIQQELIQSEKLAALGRFSSGVAHEIKNPLGIILGGSEFLELKLPQAHADVKTTIDKIKKSALRANTIVEGLLKFARPSELKTERIKPNDLVNETLSLFKYRASLRNIKIKTQFAKEDLYVEVDKDQMLQVFFNLLMNAIDAMPRGGRITIKTYRIEESDHSSNNGRCVIEVMDTGEGIPKENLQRLFEPFFTTKRDRKGTGLGLSMARMIVNNHKGNLEINSKLGKGTTAKIIIPYTHKEVQGNE